LPVCKFTAKLRGVPTEATTAKCFLDEQLSYALHRLDQGDYRPAITALKSLCEREIAHAEFILGRLYFTGYVESQDRKRGVLLIFAASRHGCELANFFLASTDVAQFIQVAVKANAEGDSKSALEILEPLAQQGFAAAYFAMGKVYETRAGSEVWEHAVRCYRTADELGCPEGTDYVRLLESL
jgi:TPR repeat protein